MPKTFPNLGPAAKLNKLRQASVNQFKIRRFFRTASQQNALTGIRQVFGSFASAIRCYYSFCELRGCEPFPARSSTAIEWSAIFNPGATFGNYVNYLKKACFFPNYPIDWATPALTNVSKGLKLEGKRKFRFPNFIDSSLLVKILQFENNSSDFAIARYLSFLFALRVPSETLSLQRAYKGGALTEFYPQREQALIGVEGTESDLRLIVRFKTRKNLPQGCIMARPCFCPIDCEAMHKLFPIHYFWPLVRNKVRSGRKLFPSY